MIKSQKLLFGIIFIGLNISLFAGGYTYRGKEISEARFKKMFEYFSKVLFADEEGRVYDPRDPETGKLRVITPGIKLGTSGTVEGTVVSSYPNVIIIKSQCTEYRTRTVSNAMGRQGLYISGKPKTIQEPYTRNFWIGINKPGVDFPVGSKFEGVILVNEAADYKEYTSVPFGVMLHPVTENPFADYMSKSNLYIYKKKVTPAETEKCPVCRGRGKVKIPKKLDYEVCKKCKGKKVKVITPEKITYRKILIK